MELRPWGIHVALVEPGATATRAPDKLVAGGRRVVEAFPADQRDLYAASFGAVIDRIAERSADGSPPEVIAAAVTRALTATRPASRYPAGGHAKLLSRMARLLPDRWLDRMFFQMLEMDWRFGHRRVTARERTNDD